MAERPPLSVSGAEEPSAAQWQAMLTKLAQDEQNPETAKLAEELGARMAKQIHLGAVWPKPRCNKSAWVRYHEAENRLKQKRAHMETLMQRRLHLQNELAEFGAQIDHVTNEVVEAETGAAVVDVEYVRALMDKYTSTHQHEDGDVIVLDNFRVGHARNPWDGSRRELYAAWTA